MERADREVTARVARDGGANEGVAKERAGSEREAAVGPIASLPGFLAGAPLPAGGEVELDADAAHHMRVRRIGVGAVVRVSDGAGRVGWGEVVSVGKRGAVVALDASHEAEPAWPRLHLLAPVADRERMLWLAEKATELGAGSWRAVEWRRSRSVSPRGAGESFQSKVRARMASALIQSGGAWLPRVEPDLPLERLPGVIPAGAVAVLLDAGGEPLLDLLDAAGDVGGEIGGAEDGDAGGVFIAVGPEGGMEEEERAMLVEAGFRPASLGTSVLRFETAGVAALAVASTALRPAAGAYPIGRS